MAIHCFAKENVSQNTNLYLWCNVLFLENCDQFLSHVCVVRKEILSNGLQRKINKNSILGISFLVNLSNVNKLGHINRRKTKHCLPNTCYGHFHYHDSSTHISWKSGYPTWGLFCIIFSKIGCKKDLKSMAPPFGVSYIKRIWLTRCPFQFNSSNRMIC